MMKVEIEYKNLVGKVTYTDVTKVGTNQYGYTTIYFKRDEPLAISKDDIELIIITTE